ncbi:cytochrome P450 [Dactylonectria macrodidyma]|uniref:Cytochrome P450 n=1 Tax=Dactylonectria macrodidyma TaxID=307937 RepID=A0A9P9FNB8_9HYPO|nr:cytochrome P450 [Dactylonectria macrodidyma]
MQDSEKLYLVLGAVSAWILVSLVRSIFTSGLRDLPGPLLAKFTNLYRLVDVSKGYNHETLVKLHDSCGDNVRFGPNVVSVRNPKDVNKIYGLKGGYVKTDFYAVQQQLANGKATQTLFTTLDEAFHARIKRPVASAYSMTTLTDYEPLVDRTILAFFKQLENRYALTGRDCPIFEWLQYYAFDVIGEVTCSENFGFIETGGDVDGIIEALNVTMDYNAFVGQIPWLDRWLKKNPVWTRIAQPTGAVAQFAYKQLLARLDESKEKVSSDSIESQKRDFVDRFFQAKETHPETVDDRQVFSYMVTNMFAGSDTTAISLRAILYYTLKHPNVYAKLMAELDAAMAAGQLSMPVTWKQSQTLPYFDAVVKEALRLHPAVGLILERIVPNQGLRLECGTVLPAGTIVGASPWVMHRHKYIYGQDVESFRPERWLPDVNEDTASYDKRLKAMKGADFTFGKGHRTCIGKNISLLEIYKMLPSFFLKYSVELADPEATWKLKNSWFVRQEGVEVRIGIRNAKDQ